jgi:hypothetical protein
VAAVDRAAAQDDSGIAYSHPLHLDDGAIVDELIGPKIFRADQVPAFKGSVSDVALVYVHIPDITHTGHLKTTIAVRLGPPPGRLYLMTNSGLQPVPPGADIGVDEQAMRSWRATHLALDMVTDIGNEKSTRITFAPADEDVDFSGFVDSDNAVDCLHFPGPIEVNWNKHAYTVLIVVNAPKTAAAILNETHCNALQGANYISKYAEINSNSRFMATPSNIYVLYLGNVYVIPIKFFSGDSIGNNGVVFPAPDVWRKLREYSRVFTLNKARECRRVMIDCAQQNLDHFLENLKDLR